MSDNNTPGFSVLHIDHIVLRVQDLARAIAFYEQVLGCSVVKRRDDLGFVHLRVGRSMIDLVAVDGPTGRQGGRAAGTEGRNLDHLCLRITPFVEQDLRQALARHGVAVTGVAADNFGAEGQGPSLYLADPDGNVIELKGPAHAGVGPGCAQGQRP